jgi:membrane protein DedA with SNARE-associated domain
VAEAACIPIPSEVTVGYAGYLASTGRLNLAVIIVLATAGRDVGAFISYAIGRYGGRAFVDRFGRYVLLSHADLDRAERWFERRGEWSVAVGRVVPLVRTFIALPAGVAEMPLLRFGLLTAAGSLVWIAPWPGAGDALGSKWNKLTHGFTIAGYVIAASWSWPSPPSSSTAGISCGPNGGPDPGRRPPRLQCPPGPSDSSGNGDCLFEGEDSRGFQLAISGDPEIEGAKPSDLLPLALASCLAYDVVVVLQKKRQELRSLVVTVESEQQDVPPFRFRPHHRRASR